ncbi:hypothetical protein Rruber_03177 [Rhodococcus ruber]
MTLAIDIFLILHFIGLAGIIGSWLAVIKEPRVVPACCTARSCRW